MKFRTEFTPQKQERQIDHHARIVLMGSCFSENIGAKLDYYKFDVLNNPFGILFHPLALEKAIRYCLEEKAYEAQDLIEHEGMWISLDHHGSFNHYDRETVLQRINENISKASNALKIASHVIITLGTAWVYRWKESGQLVANCHKIPQARFTKELLDTQDIIECLRRTGKRIHALNPGTSVIWTLSPVRHLKDGFMENNRSKARLLEAIHTVSDQERSFYFPSYELMMDDLRDYRFYSQDLVHPNVLAIDYIWEKFTNTWISDPSRQVMQEVEQIQKALHHKPFREDSEQHRKFLAKLEERIANLQKELPSIVFKKKGSD